MAKNLKDQKLPISDTVKIIVVAVGFVANYFAFKYEMQFQMQELKNEILMTNVRIDYIPGAPQRKSGPTSYFHSEAILPEMKLPKFKRHGFN